MKYYLLTATYRTSPFEFIKIKICDPRTALKEIDRLETWRYNQYLELMDRYQTKWTEPNGIRNLWLRVAETNRVPPISRMHHWIIADMAPYLTKGTLESNHTDQSKQ